MTWRAISARPYSTAKLAGVSASDITVTVADARRRLLAGVTVTYEIRTANAASASALQVTIKVAWCRLNPVFASKA